MCRSLFSSDLKMLLELLHFPSNFWDNPNYSACVHIHVCFDIVILIITILQKRVYWAEKSFMKYVPQNNSSSCIYIFRWYSHWHHNKDAIKPDYHRIHISHWRCLFPKIWITSNWGNSFICENKKLWYFSKYHCKTFVYYWENRILIKTSTYTEHCML